MSVTGPNSPAGAGYGRAASAYGVARKPAAPAAPPTVKAKAAPDDLRAVLTDEERSYFDQLGQLGPLSYGPRRGGTTPDAPRGLRLDVTG